MNIRNDNMETITQLVAFLGTLQKAERESPQYFSQWELSRSALCKENAKGYKPKNYP